MKKTYSILVGGQLYYRQSNISKAYAAYERARFLAKMNNTNVYLIWDETGEIITSFTNGGDSEC